MDTSENDMDEKSSDAENDSSDDDSINDSTDNPEYKRLVDLVWNKQDKNHDSYDIQKEILDEVLKHGDVTLASYSFEIMANCFPLTPDIWKRYIDLYGKDTDQERQSTLRELYRRALFDYYSLDLQQEYLALSLSCDNATIRTTFEEALIREGLHPLHGFRIWESYRLYESSRLSLIEENSAEQQLQLSHLADLIIRQLSTPLQYDEDLFSILTNLSEAVPNLVDVKSVERRRTDAQKQLQQYLIYENKLEEIKEENSVTKLHIYLDYISAVQNNGNTDPNFIASIYSRAVTEFCLNAHLWEQFCLFVISQKKTESVCGLKMNVDNTIINALRNVPWATDIWILKMRWQEYCNASNEEIKSTFEKALCSCNYNVHTIWMAYLEYLKRNTDFSNNDAVSLLRKTFELCKETLQNHWGEYANPVEILKFWARLEYTALKDPAKGRDLWNEVLSYNDNKSEPYLWLEMAKLEETRGEDQARKIYRRGVLECRSLMLIDAWLTYERMHGTLDSLEKCLEICNKQTHKLSEQQITRTYQEPRKRRYNFNENEKDNNKRLKFDLDNKNRKKLKAKKMKTDGVVIECDAQNEKSTKKGKESLDNSIKDVEMSSLQITAEDKRIPHDPTKDNITIFISNLDYTITEEQLVAVLKEKGDLQINETRLVKKPNGTNKGYAYVELSDSIQVQKALAMDRTSLSGRPMYISSCHGDKEQRKHGFRYAEALEKNKLFIKGLPFDMNTDELKDLFNPYGKIKDVRIVTYKSGKSKGLAFVEFYDESAASAAILKIDNMTIRSHTLSVALSDPPPRKNKASNQSSGSNNFDIKNQSLGGAVGRSQQGLVRKPKFALIPRSVQKFVAAGNGVKDVEMNEQNNTDTKPKSNDDFRKMLLGSK